MEEIYKGIKDFDNYSISNLGNVRNDKTGRIMKPQNKGNGYKQIALCVNNTKTIRTIHTLVGEAFLLKPNDHFIIDHIDENKCNNILSNLRYSTYSQNSMNKSKQSNNTTGIIGVCKMKNEKFSAQYQINSKKVHIGTYNTIEEATQARILKVNEVYGEFCNKTQKIKNDIDELEQVFLRHL